MNGGPIYAQRPSKDVARRIFVDMLHQLDANGDLRRYQYVGFGALEFIDFDLIHRELGIDRLYSIENNSSIARYEANKPYKCIELLAGESTDMLTKIDWRQLTLVWLDYESTLNSVVFTDVEYLCQKLVPGSVLAVTMNAHPGKLSGRRDRLAALIGEDRIPANTTDNTLGGWGWAQVQQRVLFSTIRRQLQKRVDTASWWQALNINYRDEAPMQMIAGVISTPAIEPKIDATGISNLFYYRPEGEALEIRIPYLTANEQRALRRSLPRTRGRRWPTLPGVSRETIQKYGEFYRWIDMH
jgi:hypothetical protein